MNYLIVGIKVSLLVIAAIILYPIVFFDSEVERATGVMNAAVFGNLAVSMFFIILVFFQHESFKHKVFTIAILLIGLLAIVESGTRGAWLSFLLLLGVYLYFFYKQKVKLSAKSKMITVLIFVVVIYIGGFNQYVTDRVYLAHTEISNWVSGDKMPSSVGLRLEMYKSAVNNIQDVPFFGHGYRTSNIVLFQDDTSSMGKISVRFNHLHNAYLTNYYNGGIVLLGALLLLLIVPLIIFIKANSQDRENPVFISGALLTLGYASFGMVNILLGDTYMNGFYTFFLAIFTLLNFQSIKISST